ncbi:hypothetical protein C1645_547339 [Glomus cerebriforme]|uniref:HTH myb-type domain-containing protein n=1 Tax=Glomus cerebriforme TaxID=658196 RepID=A0A397S5K3_9GLOM|nr:hypothetical protein C1645_547339 [Glomus cerebriforme]
MVVLFSESDEILIISYMESLGHHRDCFTRISRLMPKYTAGQIFNHWKNNLNPELCKKPFGYYEKEYIIGLVNQNQEFLVLYFEKLSRSGIM